MASAWLVKSGERILGPYTTDDIDSKIRSKEIVVIDEIASPRGRWTYIRDVPQFASVVDEIRRGLLHSREDTEIQGYTDSQTHTETNPTLNSTELSPLVAADTSTVRDADYTDAPAATSRRSSPAFPRPSVRQYGISQPEAAQPKSTSIKMKFGAGVWIGVGIIAIAVVYAIVVSRAPRVDQSKSAAQDVAVLRTQAGSAWKRADFERALGLYKDLNRIEPGRAETVTRLATLMVKFEGQTVEAKRLLQELDAKSVDPASRIDVELALGLVELEGDDVQEAVKHFTAADSSWLAQFNLGAAALQQKNTARAIAAFRKADGEPAALYMLARTLMSSPENAKPYVRSEVEQSLEVLGSRDFDFRQEALVLAAYSDVIAGKKSRASVRAKEAVETDPDMTADHFHDPRLAFDSNLWQAMLPNCRKIEQQLGSNIGKALLAICLAKAHEHDEATKLVTDETTHGMQDPLFHSAAAYVHLSAGREDAARASLRFVERGEMPLLAQILSARFCVRDHDAKCAEDRWGKLASLPNAPLSSLVGLAQARFEQKAPVADVGALLVKAENLSPHYLPSLRLREELAK